MGRLLDDPARGARGQARAARAVARWTRLSLPGDPLLEQAIDWGKQNLPDSMQDARDLRAARRQRGQGVPAAGRPVPSMRWLGAGYPDYPWLFATDGEYTAFASVAVGQFEPISRHARAARRLGDPSTATRARWRTRSSPTARCTSATSRHAGNTDETAKFPSMVALIWRWTGDDAFRDELYGFARANMGYIFAKLDADGDGWPEGLGNVEREGMGEEKLDNAVATIRGLWDLADMARGKGDGATATLGARRGPRPHRALRRRLVDARGASTRTRSTTPATSGPAAPLDRRTPMEVELTARAAARSRAGQLRPRVAALPSSSTPC